MSQIKGKTVFMVLYNYSDCDYSIIKIMEKLDDAYNYICQQESNHFDNPESFTMIEVFKTEDIITKSVTEGLNICYILSGQYNKFNLCDYHNISQYAIIPMNIC